MMFRKMMLNKTMFKSNSDLGEAAKCWASCQVFAERKPILPCMERLQLLFVHCGKIKARLEKVSGLSYLT